MNTLFAYRWSDAPRLILLTLVYALVALSMVTFFTTKNVVSIFWPPSGIGLAVLILGGARYWLGVFAGALIVNSLTGSSFVITLIISLGNMLEVLVASFMLSRSNCFDRSLSHAKNYLSLALVALICANIGASIGISMLYWTDRIEQTEFVSNYFKWWQGDVLGMILVTPFLLVWRELPHDWLSRHRSLETLALFGTAILFGQIIFLDWFSEWIGPIARGYWMYLFLVWGAVRYYRHGAMLIIGITAIQAIIGSALRIGYFGNDLELTQLNNFWCYMLVFSLVGISLCLIMYERMQAETNVLRLTDLYKALSETNQAIVRMKQEAELFPLVCRCAVDYGHMSMAWIGQLDKTQGRIRPVAMAGEGTDYVENFMLVPDGDNLQYLGPTSIALHENRPVIINNFQSCVDSEISDAQILEYGWHSAATFPIERNNQPFAVLTVYHTLLDAFDDEVVALLKEMARDVSFALDNFDREQQRQKSIIALEASERHFATLLSVTPVGVFETDQFGNCIYINKRWLAITGLDWNSAIGDGWTSALHPDDQERVLNRWLMSTDLRQPFTLEYRFLRPGGSIIWVLGQAEAYCAESGELLGYTGTITDITEKKKSEELIWRQANFDNLTGLPNRIMFLDRLEQQIKQSRRTSLSMALMFLDLDYFKDINDTLGHSMGDILLKEVASRLYSCVRDTDTVARLGGDEFTIIMTELQDMMIVERVAKDILQKMSEPIQLGNNQVYISVSIGITQYPSDALHSDVLLKNADQAMYAAKLAGRNCFHYFTPVMQKAAQERMRIASDLRNALSNQQFMIYYQPIISLATGCIQKAEALIRWQHPERGLISPIEFIPVAEEIGMIYEIGNWVFCQVSEQLKEWQTLYDASFQISVNKSPVQFRMTDKILNQVNWVDNLQLLGLSGQSIVIEITEGLLMDASEHVIKKFEKFRNHNIQIALDDFGTGYSSLSYLKKFDIDYLKIDQSFIRNLTPDSDDLALCIAIISMAHQLKIKVIAEGVETEQQRVLLMAAGCDYGQGFLWSKPVPADDFALLLQNSPNTWDK